MNKDGKLFGTYYWSIQCGIKPDYAKIIADECKGVDNLFKGKSFMPYIGDQSWHFNTNWGTNKKDSREIHSEECVKKAKAYFNKAKQSSKKDKTTLIKKGLKELGKALHPLQDIYAHIREYCYYRTLPMMMPSGYPVYIEYWKHDKYYNGIKVDGALERFSDVLKAGNRTINVLKSFTSNPNYSFLLRR